MKNKLALTALAIAMAAPGVATATEVKVGGIVQVFYYASDDAEVAIADDPDTTTVDESASGEQDAYFDGADVRVQVSASEKVGDLTGYGSIRLDSDGGLGGTATSSDSVTVGVKGAFGDIQVGEVSKVQDLGRYAGDLNKFQGDLESHIGYTGTFAPVKVRAAYSPETNEFNAEKGNSNLNYTGLGIEFDAGVATVGINTQSIGDDSANTIGAKGSFGPVSVAAHYSAIDADADGADWNNTAIKVSGKAGPASLALTMHMVGGDNESKQDVTRFDASVPVAGPVSAVLRYQSKAESENEAVAESSFTRIGLQAKF